MEKGVLAGYPLVDIKVTLIDGSYHDVDSSEMAFKIAGWMGFKEGTHLANPISLNTRWLLRLSLQRSLWDRS